jgi:hypothetical protein
LGLKLNIVFFTILTFIITGSVLIIVDQYQFWVFEDFHKSKPIGLVAQGLEMAISLISLFILARGVSRIQNCAIENGEVAISRQ